MKELITGHPFTTETVLIPEHDEFIILACDGLWDVCSDQEAVDLIRHIREPQEASKILCDYALKRYSTDNLSCMVVRVHADSENHSSTLATTDTSDAVTDSTNSTGASPRPSDSATRNTNADEAGPT